MLYASDDDIVRCTEILKKELMKKDVDFNDDIKEDYAGYHEYFICKRGRLFKQYYS